MPRVKWKEEGIILGYREDSVHNSYLAFTLQEGIIYSVPWEGRQNDKIIRFYARPKGGIVFSSLPTREIYTGNGGERKNFLFRVPPGEITEACTIDPEIFSEHLLNIQIE